MSKHVCKYFSKPWRGHKRCTFCGKQFYSVARYDEPKLTEWRPSMPLQQFANKWLPAISGTDPKKMLTVEVAFPFEWNCYESWQIVMRARFDFTDVLARRQAGLGTPVDVMNGWRSKWQEDFCRIDHEAELFYASVTGKHYSIGDNTYAEMRAVIQG